MPETHPPTFTRTIRATTVAVGPRVDDPAAQVFALTVSAGLDIARASAEARATALPWNWHDVAIRAWANVPGQTDAVACTVTPVGGAPRPSVARDADETLDQLASVKRWFDDSIDCRIERPQDELQGHERLPPTLGEQLANLATYPGDLPHALGLVRYFTVAAVDPAVSLRGATLCAFPLLAGVADPGPGKLPEWTDPAGFVTVTQAAPVDLAKPHALGTLGPDLHTYWIRVAEPLATSWRDDLTVRCREATEYFARIAELVRGTPLKPGIAEELLLRALVAHASDPWPRITRLAAAAGTATPATPQPSLTAAQVALKRLGLQAPALSPLLALPASAAEDVLVWCWEEWAGSAGPAAPEALLRDGEAGSGPHAVFGAAAAHRDSATRLAEQIIRKPELDDAVNATRTQIETALSVTSLIDTPADKQTWSDWIEAYCRALWVQLDPTNREPRREAKPSGITMQFDELNGGEVQDRVLWEQLAGVGVLIRRRPALATQWGPWRLLDAARVMRVNEADRSETDLFAPENGHPAAAIVPYRFHARDGVEYPFVTYEHRSLVAPNALDAFIGTKYETELEGARAFEARIAYRQSDARSRDLLLPPLVYGDAYQMAAFAIDLAGGMPAEITEPGMPFRAKPFTWQHGTDPVDDGSGVGAFGLGRDSLSADQHTREMTYLRHVPVGALRVRRTDARRDPDVPDDIRPLARTWLPPPGPDAHGRTPPPVPLVVRKGWQRDRIVSLEVRPPAVDIDVLERWVGLASARAARIAQLESIRTDDTPSVDDPDQGISFVDPAVKAMIVRLEEVLEGGAMREIGNATITSAQLATRDHRGMPLAIDVRVGEHTRPPTLHGQTISIELAELGQPRAALLDQPARVYRLTIDVELKRPDAADPTYPTQRFAAGIIDTTTYKLPVSYELHIELASRAMPRPQELYTWLSFDRTRPAERSVGVQLDVPDGSRAVLRNVSHGQVLRHAWRWLGRPRPEWPADNGVWPADKTFPDPDAFARWEETAFIDLDPKGDRVPADTIGLPVGHVAIEAGKPVKLLVDDWHSDRASQYLRYGVRLTSRYAAMFEDPGAATIASCRDAQGTKPGWKSVFLPARHEGTKAPVVMAWLPLTHHLDDGTDHHPLRAPPILVAFHGPVHRDHGISEGIVAELATVVDHRATEAPTLLEYGRDPIDTADTWKPPGTSPALRLEGPYGFTFEPTSSDPLFAATAYVLEPPFDADLGPDGRSRAGDFAKVRFARHVAAYPGSVQPDAEWTPAVWMQFGRAAQYLVPRHARVDGGRIVVPRFQAADGRWLYYVVVTREVMPFGGGRVSEAYVLTARLGKLDGDPADAWATPAVSLPGDSRTTLYVRVLEVQLALYTSDPDADPPVLGPPPPEGEQLWTALFPPDTASGEHAEPHLRITRVSPRATLKR